jgi:hypothetical protein
MGADVLIEIEIEIEIARTRSELSEKVERPT